MGIFNFQNEVIEHVTHSRVVNEAMLAPGEVAVSEEELAELKGQIAGINQVQTVIHFTTGGVIIGANDNFCTVVGFREDEIIGQHHRIFVDQEYSESAAYREF